eukprot:COSAG06_NODE_21909_length_741_cov_0.929907_3_plen_106_part_00
MMISQDRLGTNVTKNLQNPWRFAQDAEARRHVKEQRRLANQRKRREREAREKAAEEKEEAMYMAKLAARRAVADAEMSRMDEQRSVRMSAETAHDQQSKPRVTEA